MITPIIVKHSKTSNDIFHSNNNNENSKSRCFIYLIFTFIKVDNELKCTVMCREM